MDAGRASTVQWSPTRVVVRDSGLLSSSVSFANPCLVPCHTESRDRHALSRALSKTWPMCSHWPYRGECHIFLYFGYSKFRRWDRRDGIKRTEQGNHCKWRERGKKPVLSFLLFSFLFTLRFLFRTSPHYLNALINQSSDKGPYRSAREFHVLVLNIVLWVSGLGDVKACMHLV